MRNYSLIITAALFFLSGTASAGWFDEPLRRNKQLSEPTGTTELDHLTYYQKFLFDLGYWGDITPDTYLKWASKMKSAYDRGLFQDTEQNKQYLNSMLELTHLTECNANNNQKFSKVLSQRKYMQNAAAFISWQENLFERKCREEEYQESSDQPQEGNTEMGGH